VVPEKSERCLMQVGGVVCRWEEGRCLVFDDTRPHEVWNDTDERRVVLLIDFARPMGAAGRILSRGMHAALGLTPFVRDALRNQRRLEERFAAARSRIDPPGGGR
jgi:beta-hydroxylase